MQVVKKQRNTKDTICELYKVMISVYQEFSKDDILQQCDRLQGIYNSLFKQTIECTMFIEGYAKKSGIGMHLSLNYFMVLTMFPGCLVTMDILEKAKNFHQAFTNLKGQLSMGLAKEAVIVTLGVQESMDVMHALFFHCNLL